MDIFLIIVCAIYPVGLELDGDSANMSILYVPTGVFEGTIMDLPSDEIVHPLSVLNVIAPPLAQLEELAIVIVLEPVVAVPGVSASTAQQLPL